MVENISLILNTTATFFAALAAWFSYSVSKNSLNFQKSYAKNQNLINSLNSIIIKTRTLRTLMSDPGSISDDQFQSIEPLYLEVRANLQQLNDIDEIDFNALKLSSTTCFGDLIDNMSHDNNHLSEVIEVLESRINGIFK